jgi:hypothetical protein
MEISSSAHLIARRDEETDFLIAVAAVGHLHVLRAALEAFFAPSAKETIERIKIVAPVAVLDRIRRKRVERGAFRDPRAAAKPLVRAT